jgi:sortase (surface protein transpeptidase)
MSSIHARPNRILLTLGLVVAFAASLPLSAGASGTAPTTSARLAETTIAVVKNHPPAWTAEVAHATLARIRAAEAAATAAAAKAAPKPAPAKTTVVKKTTTVKTTTTRVYAGTNHLWIPSLGISHSVTWFACTRSTPPGAGVYRWGCAGKNNVYLFGHAWSTMKPLHDAYVAGRLHLGMVAYYADGNGRVHGYKVTAIKLVTPDQTAWAIAAQKVPSMTLQTCVGSKSQYRLLVRLVAFN